MSSRPRSARTPLLLLLALALASPIPRGQGAPPCALPDDNPLDDVRPLWGGEIRGLHALDLPNGAGTAHHVWAVGDGGVIRHSVDAGPWESQTTPLDASTTLLDVWFLPDGTRGWACGSGGVLLYTDDLGDTWHHLPAGTPPRVCGSECATASGHGELATLWRVRFLDANRGFVAGLWTFKWTDDGGATWNDVVLDPGPFPTGTGGGGTSYHIPSTPMCYEFYGLEIRQMGSQWVALASAQVWAPSPTTGACPAIFLDDPVPHGGIVFRSDGDLGSWSAVFLTEHYNDNNPPPAEQLVMVDPWDIAFDPDPALGLDQLAGYVVGGTGTQNGTIVSFADGGDQPSEWAFEWGGTMPFDPNNPQLGPLVKELYGVEALSDGRVVATGYGGELWMRNVDPLSGVVTWKGRNPKFNGHPYTAPMGAVEAATWGADDCLFAGAFGFLGTTTIPPVDCKKNVTTPCNLTWSSSNLSGNSSGSVNRQDSFRFNDLWFFDGLDGFAVGQHVLVAETDDGGCTWTVRSGGPGNNMPNQVPPVLIPTSSLQSIAFKPNGKRGVAVGVKGYVATVDRRVDPPLVVRHQPDSDWTLQDVAHASGPTWYAVGKDTSNGRALIVRSNDNGANWSKPLLELPDGLDLTGVALQSLALVTPSLAVAVGYIPNTAAPPVDDEPRAFLLQLSPVSVAIGEITPYALFPNGSDGRLHQVAYNAASGDLWIAGGPNILAKWGGNAFVPVSTGLALPPTCGGSIGLASLDYRSLSISPSGDVILVGPEGIAHEHLAPELGYLYRSTDAGASWDRLRSRTNEDVLSLFLVSDTLGWMVAANDNRASVLVPDFESSSGWSRPDVEKEWGSVGDAALNVYDAGP